MIREHRLLCMIAIVLLLGALTSCGQRSSSPGGSTPPPTASVTPSPSPSPTLFPTATTGSVTLHVGAASYHPNDTIVVTIQNASSSAIFFPDHLTNCTVIQLQFWRNGNWDTVNKCQLMILTGIHTLDAGQSLTVRLVPSSRPWSVGLYQATLHYQSSSKTSTLSTAYSAGFQVA